MITQFTKEELKQNYDLVAKSLDNEFELVNFLQHLYLSEDDWHNKKEFVWIEK